LLGKRRKRYKIILGYLLVAEIEEVLKVWIRPSHIDIRAAQESIQRLNVEKHFSYEMY
jgi:hypothetical protein